MTRLREIEIRANGAYYFHREPGRTLQLDQARDDIKYLLTRYQKLKDGIEKHKNTKYPIQIDTGLHRPQPTPNSDDKELYKLLEEE